MSQATSEKRWGIRSIAALLVFVIAVVLTPIALIGHWGHRTIADNARYVQTVGPLIDQPAVRDGLTAAITDAVEQNLDTETMVDDFLGNLLPNFKFTDQLAGPISAGINSLIGDLVARFVNSEQFATAWVALNSAAQQGLMKVLNDEDGGVVKLQGDNLVLDINATLGVIQQHLVDRGITAAANISLPDNDRTVVLMSAPAFAQIKFIYGFTAPILEWLPLLVAALFALAAALSRRRARMIVAVGISLLIWGVVLIAAMNAGEGTFQNQLADTPFAAAAGLFWSTLFQYLIWGIQAVIAMGIVLIVAGWFGGRTKSASMLRGNVVTGLGQISDRMPAGMAGLGGFLRRYATAIRWIIFALVLLLVLQADLLSVNTIFWGAALGAGLITVHQLLAGVGARSQAKAGDAVGATTSA